MINGKKLVWILDDEWTNHELEEEIFNDHGFVLKVSNSKTLEQDQLKYGPLADGVIAQVGFDCGESVIKELTSCKVIASYGVGFNHIDIETAHRMGIPVCNVPDYCVEEVSDHTIALMLAVVRRLQSYHNQVKSGHWDALDTKSIKRMKDMTIGLLGFGRIAREVARKIKPFGARIIACDQYVPKQIFEEYGVDSVSLEELMMQSNLLSLHVPLLPETENLINAERLKLMPKGALIVNTCRGGVINEEDLIQLIAAEHIGGAGLDVLKQEPPEFDYPLLNMPEVLITPHASYISDQSVTDLRKRTCQIIIDGINGIQLENIVNQKPVPR